MRKLLALLLSLAVVMLCLPALSEQAADPFARYDEPVTITVVKNLGAGSLDFPEGDSIDDNVWTRAYKEKSISTLNSCGRPTSSSTPRR